MVRWIIVVIIVLVGISLLVARNRNEHNSKLPDGDGEVNSTAIDEFTYKCGGGSLNAHYALILKGDSLSVERCEGNGSKTRKKNYTVPPEMINDITDIIFKSGMRDWEGSFERSELFALDAETTSVAVSFTDDRFVSFNSDLIIPDGGWEAVNEVVRMFESIADK